MPLCGVVVLWGVLYFVSVEDNVYGCNSLWALHIDSFMERVDEMRL